MAKAAFTKWYRRWRFLRGFDESQDNRLTRRKNKDEWFSVTGLFVDLLQVKAYASDEFGTHLFFNKQPDGL